MNMNMIQNPGMNNNRINVLFRAVRGVRYNLAVARGIKISEMIREYLIRIEGEHLFQDNSNIIQFIYNGRAIDIRNNNSTVEDFFHNCSHVEIQIVTNDLVGA